MGGVVTQMGQVFAASTQTDYKEEEEDTLYPTTQPNLEHHIPLTVNRRHSPEQRAYLC
jgi:hypothetical protein